MVGDGTGPQDSDGFDLDAISIDDNDYEGEDEDGDDDDNNNFGEEWESADADFIIDEELDVQVERIVSHPSDSPNACGMDEHAFLIARQGSPT